MIDYDKNQFEIIDLYESRLKTYEKAKRDSCDFKFWDEEEQGCTPEEYREELLGGLNPNEKFVLIRYKGSGGEVIIPDGVTSISSQVFRKNANIKRVYIPDSVTSMGNEQFYYCTALEEVRLSDNLIMLGAHSFRGCTALKKVYMGKSIIFIGFDAFYGCSSLKSIDLPPKLEEISSGAFADTGLEEVYIPENVENIDAQVFSYCNNIKKIEVHPQNPYFYSRDNCVYAYKHNMLMIGLNDGTIPADGKVGDIFPEAFEGNHRVTRLTIPNGIKYISSGTFSDCINLRSVILPDTIESIGPCAFSRCAALKEIVVPSSVKKIDRFAFESCGLERVVIKRGVKEIGEHVFFKCNNLKEIFIPSTVENLGYDIFDGCGEHVRAYIENGEQNNYENYKKHLSSVVVEFTDRHEIFD